MDTPCRKNGQRFFTPLPSQISQPPKRNEMIQNMRFMLAPPRPHWRGQYRYLHSLRRLFLGAIIESYTYQKRNYSLKCQKVTNYLTLKIAKKKRKWYGRGGQCAWWTDRDVYGSWPHGPRFRSIFIPLKKWRSISLFNIKREFRFYYTIDYAPSFIF